MKKTPSHKKISIAIQSSPWLATYTPFFFIAAFIGSGWILYIMSHTRYLSQTEAGMIGTGAFFGFIIMVLIVVLAKKTMSIDENNIVVRLGFIRTIRINRSRATYHLSDWSTMSGHFSLWHKAGPQLEVRIKGKTRLRVAAIGSTHNNEITPAQHKTGIRFIRRDIPDALIGKEDFCALQELLSGSFDEHRR